MDGRQEDPHKLVALGRIAGAHGIQGWVRVFSHTEPREAILDYRPWLVGDAHTSFEPIEGGRHGKTVIARLEGIEDRDHAERLVGQEISVPRGQLPKPAEQQFYWVDLIGLRVVNRDGASLGSIEDMMATGAHDVMVVRGERERLIPFVVGQVVSDIDLDSGQLTVDWEADY